MAAKTHMDEGTEGAVLNATEARQGGRPRATLWVLLISIALGIIAGLVLAQVWNSFPS